MTREQRQTRRERRRADPVRKSGPQSEKAEGPLSLPSSAPRPTAAHGQRCHSTLRGQQCALGPRRVPGTLRHKPERRLL